MYKEPNIFKVSGVDGLISHLDEDRNLCYVKHTVSKL